MKHEQKQSGWNKNDTNLLDCWRKVSSSSHEPDDTDVECLKYITIIGNLEETVG